MANNTTLNSGTTGDVIRDLDRLTAGVKTQVVQLDQGGASTNAESFTSIDNPLWVGDKSNLLMLDLLRQLLQEMRINNFYLQAGLNVKDDVDALRADPYFNTYQ